IITQLFDKKQVVAGTDVRVDFSFSVDSLGMDIELADLPGGFTTNRNYWDDEEVRKDLQNADGASFFISAYDVINNPSEALKVNRAFADAISEIRKHTQGDVKGRSDVPIWFIFTKGDTVPEVPVDVLASKVPSLLDAAKKQQIRGNWFARSIYKKGGYVRSYKSQSLGTWIDSTTLPENFEPVNVVEPVEEMFEAMLESRGTYISTFTKIIIFCAVIVTAGTFGASYWLDGVYWRSIEDKVKRARERNDYAAAIKLLDEFSSPFTSVILPGFVRAGGNRNALRDETYREYEAELYAPIAAEIEKINESTLPELDAALQDTLKRVETYLDTSHFASVSPEHYARVRSSAWYFEAARLFNTDPTREEISPDEEFEIILRCLNYEAPESWRNRIQVQVDKLLRHWSKTSPSLPEVKTVKTDNDFKNLRLRMDSLDIYIDGAGQLINHPNISGEVSEYLTGRIKSWREEKAARWNEIAEYWVNEANSVMPDEGLMMLSSHLAERITPEVKVTLETARVSLYGTIADQALREYADDMDELRRVLNKYPSMPNVSKEKISSRINFLWEQHIEERIKSISSSKTIGSLAKLVSELGDEMKQVEIKQAVSSTLSNLVDARIQDIEAEAGTMLRENNFSDGKQYIRSAIQKLQQEIQGAVDSSTASSHVSKVKALEQELMNSLMNANVEYCRRAYNSRKNTRSERDITVCLNTMNEFIQLWPEAMRTREGSEIRRVSEFLRAIQGGVQGRLHIVSGNFPEGTGEGSTPDMQITIVIGSESWSTKTIDDNVNPIFNEWISLKWDVSMSPVRFIGIDIDVAEHDTCFRVTVDPSGFKGYEAFSQTFRDGGGLNNTLTVKFEPDKNIPVCPW
ncbi:MAG: hypothetical protein IJP54_09175, partial [Synergistaceae bacterium]|nr:hypothetical protein [Synergistaceae bacterium]